MDELIDRLFASTPLPFIKEFLRDQKKQAKQVRIGTTKAEMKANLRDAMLAKLISEAELTKWLVEVEGWGKQHLYIYTVPRRSLTQSHVLNRAALSRYITKHKLDQSSLDVELGKAYVIDEIEVDDEVARISWRCHSVHFERREELDETRELDDGDYIFRAFRIQPRRSASKCIIRKTDGVVIVLVDLPLNEEHEAVRDLIHGVATQILAPLTLSPTHLGPVVTALDSGAMRSYGPRASRSLSMGVAPTQARFRADGARLEFKSTRESSGYADCDAVRGVRRAMMIEHFVGEAGKFRLTFDSDTASHDMIVSLSASHNRTFLFSRMRESEVLALVDQFLSLVSAT